MADIHGVRVYVRKELDQERKINAALAQLIDDFKSYKRGEHVSYFGKDVPYHDPKPYAERAKLRHVHILARVRSIRVGGSSSDSALVYTEGSMVPNAYYVIDYLEANAHARARDPAYMAWLIETAEAFRMKV